MTETTINQATEIPSDYQTIFAEKLTELKNINQNLERNRDEIDWLNTETRKTLDRIKEFIKEK
jgi:hypothetical protein